MAGDLGQATHITAAVTTNITPARVFKSCIINTQTAGTITISDGTPGNVLAVITGIAAAAPVQLDYNTAIASGNIRVVTSAITDITILWE